MERKVLILGEPGVGKTSIQQRFTNNRFPEDHLINIDPTPLQQRLQLRDGSSLKFEELPLGGRRKPLISQGTAAVMFVYDATNINSFRASETMINSRIRELKESVNKDSVVFVLVGNKCDMVENPAMNQHAKILAETHKMLFSEVSARTGEGVDELFKQLSERIIFASNRPKNRMKHIIGLLIILLLGVIGALLISQISPSFEKFENICSDLGSDVSYTAALLRNRTCEIIPSFPFCIAEPDDPPPTDESPTPTGEYFKNMQKLSSTTNDYYKKTLFSLSLNETENLEAYVNSFFQDQKLKLDFITVFQKFEPVFLDIIQRRADLASSLLLLKEALHERNATNASEFLKNLTPREIVLMMITRLTRSDRSEFAITLNESGYPLPLFFQTGNNQSTFLLELLENFYLSNKPLIVTASTRNVLPKDYFDSTKAIFQKDKFPLNSYSYSTSLSNPGSADLYLENACSKFHLIVIHGSSKDQQFSDNIEILFNFSSLTIIQATTDDLENVNKGNNDLADLLERFNQALIPARGHFLLLISKKSEKDNIKNKTGIEDYLRTKYGSRFVGIEEMQHFSTIPDHAKERIIKSLRKSLLSRIERFNNQNYNCHSPEKIEKFIQNRFNSSKAHFEEHFETRDTKYLEYFYLLNNVSNLTSVLPLTLKNIQKNYKEIYPVMFHFNSNKKEIEKKEVELKIFKSRFNHSTDLRSAYEIYQNLEIEIKNFKLKKANLSFHPVILEFANVFKPGSYTNIQAGLAIKDWISPIRDNLISLYREAENKDDKKIVADYLSDIDISLDSIIHEIVEGDDDSGVAMNLKEYLKEQTYRSKPINLITENLIYGNKLIEEIFKNLKWPGKYYVISVFGPQSSGKSTLLNYLFGASFATAEGRCTKGVYFTVFRLASMDMNIVVLDSEGIMSANARDEKFDRQLVTFLFSISNLVIINHKGQPGEPMSQLLQVCAYALEALEMNDNKPLIFWALQNMQPQDDYEWGNDVQVSNLIDVVGDMRHRFDFQFENLKLFTSPFDGCENYPRFGEQVLNFREKIYQRLHSGYFYETIHDIYKKGFNNWRIIKEYGSEILRIRYLLHETQRKRAIDVVHHIVGELRHSFSELENTFTFQSDVENSKKITEDLDMLLEKVYQRGKELLQSRVFKNEDYSKIADSFDHIQRNLYVELLSVRKEYIDKLQFSLNAWELKEKLRLDTIAIKNMIINCGNMRKDELIEKIKNGTEETIRAKNDLCNRTLYSLIDNIYKAFKTANEKRNTISIWVFSLPDIFTKYWPIPESVDLLKRIKDTEFNLDLPIHEIKEKWIGGFLPTSDDVARKLKIRFLVYLKHYEPSLSSSSSMDFEQAMNIIQRIEEFRNTLEVSLTKEFDATLMKEVMIIEWKNLAKKIENNYEQQVATIRDDAKSKIEQLDGVNTETEDEKCNFGRQIARNYFESIYHDIISQYKAQIFQELTAFVQESTQNVLIMNDWIYDWVFKRPKAQPEDYHEVIKYVLDQEKYIQEVYYRAFLETIKPNVARKVTEFEKIMRAIQKIINELLSDLQQGNSKKISSAFNTVRKIQLSPDSASTYIAKILSESHLDETDKNSILEQVKQSIKSHKEKHPVSKYEEAADLAIHLLDITQLKGMDSPELVKKCSNEIDSIKKMKKIKYSDILDLFKKEELLSKYSIPEYSINQTMLSVDPFIKSFLNYSNNYLDTLQASSIEHELMNYVYEHLEKHKEDLVGCRARCPICGQKCSKHRHHSDDHYAHKHLPAAFTGHHNSSDNKAYMHNCADPESHKTKWGYENLTLSEYANSRSPNNTWTIIEDNNYNSSLHDQIRAWLATGDFFLHYHKMANNTPEQWQSELAFNKRLGTNPQIPGYTDRINFTKLLEDRETNKTSVLKTSKKLDIVFCIDITGSMGPYLSQAKSTIQKLISETKSLDYILGTTDIRFGFVGYRDHGDLEIINMKDLVEEKEILNFIQPLQASGGADHPEAALDGLNATVNKISWRNKSSRYIFHICDAPPHGREFHDGHDIYPNGCPCGLQLKDIANKIKEKQIMYKLMLATPNEDKMVKKFSDEIPDLEHLTLNSTVKFENQVVSIVTRDITLDYWA